MVGRGEGWSSWEGTAAIAVPRITYEDHGRKGIQRGSLVRPFCQFAHSRQEKLMTSAGFVHTFLTTPVKAGNYIISRQSLSPGITPLAKLFCVSSISCGGFSGERGSRK